MSVKDGGYGLGFESVSLRQCTFGSTGCIALHPKAMILCDVLFQHISWGLVLVSAALIARLEMFVAVFRFMIAFTLRTKSDTSDRVHLWPARCVQPSAGFIRYRFHFILSFPYEETLVW